MSMKANEKFHRDCPACNTHSWKWIHVRNITGNELLACPECGCVILKVV